MQSLFFPLLFFLLSLSFDVSASCLQMDDGSATRAEMSLLVVHKIYDKLHASEALMAGNM